MPPSPPIVTLLTDFGVRDPYVGQVKGAILAVCPEARIVDLTHEIPPGDLLAAAIAWSDSVNAFPVGTIHLAVVDPGVGSSRRALAVEAGPCRCVCPDNGLITLLWQRGTPNRGVELTNSRYWRPEMSPVFHGRDLFAPVAAAWANGCELTEFGPWLTVPPVLLDLPTPLVEPDRIQGTVLQRDHFGNLRTNIDPAPLLAAPADWSVQIQGTTIQGINRCFSDVPRGGWVALQGSHGQLEIALNQGNAAQVLQVEVGTPVLVTRTAHTSE